jgi:cytochrome c biogenesis protein CcmG/thiol:disulfide interchange protein DsbE
MMIEMLRRPRRWWRLTLAVLLAGLLWAAFSRAPTSAASAGQLPSPRAGFPAPDFTLNVLTGEALSLADLRGQVVIINLWASWCVPCRAEMPTLQEVYVANHSAGLTVLGVNSTYQDNPADAANFVHELGLTFPIALDVDGVVSHRYLLRALPTTFFVDRTGIIRQVIVGGPMSAATLQSEVDALLRESP